MGGRVLYWVTVVVDLPGDLHVHGCVKFPMDPTLKIFFGFYSNFVRLCLVTSGGSVIKNMQQTLLNSMHDDDTSVATILQAC